MNSKLDSLCVLLFREVHAYLSVKILHWLLVLAQKHDLGGQTLSSPSLPPSHPPSLYFCTLPKQQRILGDVTLWINNSYPCIVHMNIQYKAIRRGFGIVCFLLGTPCSHGQYITATSSSQYCFQVNTGLSLLNIMLPVPSLTNILDLIHYNLDCFCIVSGVPSSFSHQDCSYLVH